MQDIYLGYDPGGGGAHGVALISGSLLSCTVVDTAEAALQWFRAACENAEPKALGVDTLTLWSTGPSGWRPADRALRAAYPQVASSVVAPNSLFGAMPLNGAVAALLLLDSYPNLLITETHPKVLYFALTGEPWDFSASSAVMNDDLSQRVGSHCSAASPHAWDAAISAYAARELATGNWSIDLHARPCVSSEQLVPAHARPHYAWPVPLPATPDKPGAQRPSARSQTRRERWQLAVERLIASGHEDVAEQVSQYRNARRERSGWDSWFRNQFPGLLHIVERADD